MFQYTKKEFRKYSIHKKHKILKECGEYIGARIHGTHRVHLYAVSGFYVEMWIIIAINEIQWIEVQDNKDILLEYTKDVDVKGGLGLG